MTNPNILKNPHEDSIVEEVAEGVASDMISEIREEVAVWVGKQPITSTKVRSTDVTKVFQERFARQLVERQEQVAEQIVLRRQKDLQQVPTGYVGREILARETQAVLNKEGDFLEHVLRCALLATKIAAEKAAFDEDDKRIGEMVERELETVLKVDREKWMEMAKVSETEFDKEWEENFRRA
jgi:hypothetical protein